MPKHSPEIQVRMIAHLLQKERDAATGRWRDAERQKGVRLFRHFHKVDAETFAATFSFSGIAPVLAVLGEFYAKHKDLPSRLAYDNVKLSNLKYQRWHNESSEKDQRKLRELESELFEPHADDRYVESELVEFITRSFLVQLAHETSKYLIDGGKTPAETLAWVQDEAKRFRSELEDDLGIGNSEGFKLLAGRHDVSRFKEADALPTMFSTVRLYFRGLSVLVAPPKSFKTGISQNIALDLMKRGCDVLFIDLENGDVKMNRRFHQALLRCPKEWLYAGVWIDRVFVEESTGMGWHDPEKLYRKGHRVWKHGFEVAGEGDDKVWSVWAKVYEAVTDAAETVEDWEEVTEIQLPEGAVMPAQEAAELVLEQLREETGGDIALESMRGASVAKIAAKVSRHQDDSTPFYDGSRRKVLIIDWGQKVKNSNTKLAHWERHRDNYEQYAALCEGNDLHMLVIEAPQDYSKLSDPHFNIDNLQTAGTGNIQYDAVSVSVVLATADEKNAGYRRIAISVDRDSPRLVDYIKVEYENFRAYTVPWQQHRDALPELWAEWDRGERNEPKRRKGEKAVDEKIADFVMDS